jgi:KaiC/GvpD/RAD55 family RecA-like ATPase
VRALNFEAPLAEADVLPLVARRDAEVALHTASPETLATVVARWKQEGPLVRLPTGFATLDAACRGGLPLPWRALVIGAPSAGKTAFVMVLLRRFVQAGLVCGVLGVDEEPDDLCVRASQMLGFSVEQCESREPAILGEIAAAAARLPIRFYDFAHTIEAAAADLATWASAQGRRAVLAIDSIQSARCNALANAERAPGPREVVEANVRALRAAAATHRLLVLATSEANRGSYRSEEAAESGNDMAAGKESSAIEYAAQTLLMVRTPKDYPNHVRVTVPKNRRGARAGFDFFLRLDRERHELTECADPTTGDAAHSAQKREVEEQAATRAETLRNARILAELLRSRPGLGERELRAAVRAAGHRWGIPKFDAAKERLARGVDGERLVNTGDAKRTQWRLERFTPTEKEDNDG